MNEEEAKRILIELSTFDYVKLENGDVAIEAVLNLLEKKDKQIEQYQNMLATNDMLHVIECEKKDKMIYEMIDFIDAIDGCLCFDLESRNCIDKNCKECIKQYFERKVENGN